MRVTPKWIAESLATRERIRDIPRLLGQRAPPPAPLWVILWIWSAANPARCANANTTITINAVFQRGNFIPVRSISPKQIVGCLLGAILVQKAENVVGPDIGPKITERVAVSGGVAVGGINFQFVGLARFVHLR